MNNTALPVVSVLTTVYNREKYIAACIESVINSTFSNWEMIIVDDQSKDKSLHIANQFAQKDSRIRVYKNETNLGDYPNRNKAASYAKGKYIKYLDADDLIYPHGLEIMVKTMEAFPEAALGISQEVAEDFAPYPFQMLPLETFRREYLQRGVLGLGPTGTIIKRDIFEKLNCFTGTRYIGDFEMWHKIAMYYPVVKMVPGLSFWRRHDDQEISKGQESMFYLENAYKHNLKILNNPDNPLLESEKELAIKTIQKRFGRDLLSLLFAQKQPKKAWQIKKACNFSTRKLLASIIK